MSFIATSADLNLQGQLSAVSGRQIIFQGSSPARTITLGGANTYDGPTAISGVTVKASTLANMGSNSSLGTGANGGALSITNGVLSYTGGAAGNNFPLSISGASTIRNDGSGALSLTGATTFGTGTPTFTLGGSYTGTNTLSGAISGTGNLAMNGAGTWILGGVNTYTGSTTVQSGTLVAGSAQALGTPTGLIVNGGTLDLNSQAITAPSLAGTGGTVNLGSGSLTLNAASGSTTYAGNIIGSGSLTKVGASSLTLSGANIYTGATTVGGGTLTLDFTAAGAPASNIINSASTLNISGGTLAVNGKAGTSNSQSFNGLNVTSGSNKIVATAGSGGTLTLGLGAINQSGGVADFGFNTGATITTSHADGALGGWATVNGTDYAQVSGGVITALTNYANKDDASTWANGDIVSDAGGAANTPYFNTVSGNVALGGLKYTAAANSTVTVGSGNTLGVGGNILVTSTVGSTSQTIQGGSLTGGPNGGPLGVLQNSAGTYTIASTIVDNGAPTSFTVGGSGTGAVSLTGANTYTGATTVSGSTLAFNSVANGGSASAIGASSNASSNLVLQSGTLRYTGATASTDRGFTLQNGGTSRTIQVDGSSNLTFGGLVTSPDNAGLNVTGTGTLTLANASNNFVGPINVNGGTLAATNLANGGQVSSIGAASNASSNLVLQNGGTLAYTGGTASTDHGFTLGNGTAGNVGQANVSQAGTTLTDSGTVVGSGALVKGGAGTLVLSGTNTYTGGTTVNAGTLRAGSNQAFGGAANGAGAGPMTVKSGATLDLAGNSVWVGGLNGAGSVTLGAGTLQINNSGTFSGNISGSGGVATGAGAGTQTFSGCNNTYSGATTIAGGSGVVTDCLANGLQASGIGASSNAASNLVFNNGTLAYTGTSVNIDRGAQLQASTGTINVNNSGTTLGLGGTIQGAGTLVKVGSGTLLLNGSNNPYSGGTGVSAGTLQAGAVNAFGTGVLVMANASGALADLNGFNTAVAYLFGGGTTGGNISLGGATLTVTSGSSLAAANYAGAITGNGNFVKSGSFTQYLSGTANTYNGTTTINGGTLAVNSLTNGGAASSIGSSSNAAGNLVLNGGTLQYLGTGNSTDRMFTLGPSATSALDASGTGAVQFANTGAIAFSSPNTAQTVTLTGSSTSNNSLAAQITDNGTGQTSFSKTGTGTWILNNPASSYTGVTTIAGGVLGVNKLSNGGQASSIGSSSNAASNLIIGSGSTLLYTGSGDTTDRLFTLSTGVSYISSSGTGAVVFSNTGSASYSGSGNRTLALGGTNTGLNTMGGTIIDGPGGTTTLAKNDAGTWVLTGNNSYTGNTVINNGNLMIGNGGTTGNAGAGNVIVDAPTSTLSFNRSNAFNFTGTLSGPGTIAQIGTGTTVLTSANNFIGNTTVSAGTLQVNGGLTSGGATVGAGTLQVQAGGTLTTPTIAMNTGSTLTVNGTVGAAGGTAAVFSGNTGPSTINVNSGGTLTGNGTLGSVGGNVVNLSGTLNTGSGTLNLGAGNDTLVLNDGGTINGIVDGGSTGVSGAGDTLVVNNTANRTLNTATVTNFETLLKQGTGTLTLTGTQSYSAGTTVQAGTLLVDGNQTGTAGPTSVQSGATLGGTGTIAGDVTVANGAALSPGDTGAVGTLTVNGNLTLNSGAALNYQFGQANTPGGAFNDLTNVNGNLTLGGTLNVNTSPGGSFNPGVYRIINYGGTLTNNGLSIGSAPAGSYSVQTSVANQVNLVNSTGLTLNFWDGAAGPKNNGAVNGGNGTWQNSAGNDNWADSTGQVNAAYTNGAFAVFEAAPGTVTIDNSLGNVTTSGMQFAVNGYTITGNALTLTGSPNIIRVGDGTAAGAGMTATINSALVGTGGLQKTDLGTLVLSGTNTYTGGTSVTGGTLQVASDANLGDASGGLTLDGGTLRNTGAFTSARAVTLGTNGGTFDTQANLTLSGTIGGAGALTKTSSGTLTLTGVNTYGGGTSINGGTVAVSSDANLGNANGPLSFNSGTLQNTASFGSARAVTLNAGGGTFQTTGDLTLTGAIGGAGALTKTDAGTLLLTANNTYTGGTTIAAGALQLGNGSTSGSITGNVTDNGALVFDRSDTYSFGGVISGSGTVTQQGTGVTVLTGNNSYAGNTAVNAGTLIVDGNQSVAAGATSVASGATLGGNGTIGGNVVVGNGATLNPGDVGSVPGTLSINGNLALGNASKLNYNFGQANVVGGAYNDLTKVGGNLTLGGTLNVTTTPGASFDPGVYRIISYGGTLTNNGLAVGTVPSPNYFVQTSVNHQVNLVNTAGLPVNFWDGPGHANDGIVQGGTGVWQNAAGNTNWTLADGSMNGTYQDSSFAVFEATPGTVTVDNSLGAVKSEGMQFAVDGYTVQGGPISLVGSPNIIRVGDGTADGAAMTATIASALTGTGGVQKTDLGTLVLTGANTYSGGTTITAGTLQLGNGGTSGSITGDVVDNSALVFKRSDSVTFGGAISGSGSVTQAGTGTTVLTGANAYSGATNVKSGTLLVNGNQSGATGLTTVQGGATLGGIGTLGGDVTIASGGSLSPGNTSAPGTLTVNGNLSLSSGSTLNYRLGQADTVGGALNDLTVVHGNLALAGTLNVSTTPGGSFGPGVYRLFNYDGGLTYNGLALGTVPAGNLFVQTSIAHEVNLVNSTGLTLNYWDGPNGQNNGVIEGGNGIWRLVDNASWTEATGSLTAPYSDGSFAVFEAAPGTVMIDNSKGQVLASGMQFAVDGYRIAGDTLALTGTTPTIRVGDGTAAGANMTAAIDSMLTGTGTLTKADLGTLVLNGNNAYTGGTNIQAGTLRISSDANLGAANGSLTIGSGTLETTGTTASARSVALTGAATLLTDPGTTLTLSGPLAGSGSLMKAGSGTLLLQGADTHTGGTEISAGTLKAGAAQALSAASTYAVDNGAVLDLNGFQQTVAALSNAGTVSLNGAPGTALTVAGSYAGLGGTVQLHTALGGDGSATDRLVVQGDTSGTTTLKVVNVGGPGAQTVNGIKVVDVAGESAGTFALQGDYAIDGEQAVVGGAYAYTLQKNGISTPNDGDWYLRSKLANAAVAPAGPLYQPGAPLYEAYPQVLLALNDLPTLQQRLGNRYWSDLPFTAPAPADAASNGAAAQPSVGWARVEGRRLAVDASHSTTGTQWNVDEVKTQAGLDALLMEKAAGRLFAGIGAQYGHGGAGVNSFFGNGAIDVDGYGVTGTATWAGTNGFYVDGQAQATWYDSSLTSGLLGRVMASHNKGFGHAFGIESGQRIALAGPWSVTPQAQLVYSSVTFDGFTDPFGARVSRDKATSLTSRLGVSLDYNTAWRDAAGHAARADFYGLTNVYYDFLGGTTVNVSGTPLSTRADRLWAGIGVGGSLSWKDDRFAVYGELLVRSSLDGSSTGHDYRANAGVRVRW
jgi:fibronectin-binding autotransporter adhesin